MQKFSQVRGVMKKMIFFDQRFSIFFTGFGFFLLCGLASCGNATFSSINAIGANITPIKELTVQQNNSTVYIQGKIEKHAPLLNKHAYQLNDSTGKILVLTNQSGLKVGSQIVIKGQLRYKSIPLAGQELGEVYLEEK